METRKNQVIAGAFVIVLTVGIILAVIWLSSGFSLTGYATYKVIMQESVSGLNVDAVVEFNGVSVGRVKSVRINRKNPRQVMLLLAISDTTPITEGTRAVLNVRGLTGISYISLKDKGTDLRPLTRRKGQKWPVIPTAPSLFLQMDAALGKLNENVSAATQSIRALLNDENLREISCILKNLRTLSVSLNKNDRQVTEILNNTINITHALPEFLSDLNQTIANLTAFSNEISQNPALLIRGRVSAANGPGE